MTHAGIDLRVLRHFDNLSYFMQPSPRSPYPARHHLEGEVTRILLRSCLARDNNARSFAEIACLYLMRHLATGAIEDYSITKAAELGSSAMPVLEALEEDWGLR